MGLVLRNLHIQSEQPSKRKEVLRMRCMINSGDHAVYIDELAAMQFHQLRPLGSFSPKYQLQQFAT